MTRVECYRSAGGQAALYVFGTYPSPAGAPHPPPKFDTDTCVRVCVCVCGLTLGDIVAEMAVDVALSDAGNHTSERREAAPQMNTLQRDAIVCPLKSTQK